jgi:hypothetical protein
LVANGDRLGELQGTVTTSGTAVEHSPRVVPTAAVAPSDQLMQNNGEESGKISQHFYRFLLWVLISISLSLWLW